MIKIPSQFEYLENKFLTSREKTDTLDNLRALNLEYYPQGFVIYVEETNKRYILDKTKTTPSTTTGYWSNIKAGVEIYPTIAELVADTDDLEDGKLAVCTEEKYYGIWQYKANEEEKETIGKWRSATNTSGVSVNDIEKETNDNDEEINTQAKVNIDNVAYFKDTLSLWQSGRTYGEGKVVWFNHKLWKSLKDYNKGNEPSNYNFTYWECVFPYCYVYKILGSSLDEGVDNVFNITHNLNSTIPIVYSSYQEGTDTVSIDGAIWKQTSSNGIKLTLPACLKTSKLKDGTIWIIIYDGGAYNFTDEDEE